VSEPRGTPARALSAPWRGGRRRSPAPCWWPSASG